MPSVANHPASCIHDAVLLDGPRGASRRRDDRSTPSPTAGLRSVLIVDEQEPFLTSLGRSFGDLGFEVWIESSCAAALALVRTALPDLVVLDLNLGGQSLAIIPEVRRLNPSCSVVITTLCPSIATATEATRLGANAYLTKPVSAPLVLSMLEAGDADEAKPGVAGSWPSLERTIWEYLNQVFLAAGSMSEAARRLRLDRTSLRRMLAKAPPEV